MTDQADEELLGGRRVLVVEDEIVIAMLLEDFVEELGGGVVGPVGSADRAMKLIETEEIGVATLDVNIADGNIYDAAAALNSRSIPFVFVTGYSELPESLSEFCGMPRLKKPFTLEELADVFGKAIDGNGSSS